MSAHPSCSRSLIPLGRGQQPSRPNCSGEPRAHRNHRDQPQRQRERAIMKKRIKWIVGVGALVAAPLSLLSAPTAHAGVGSCTTAALGEPVVEAGPFLAFCSVGAPLKCLGWHNPLTSPVDQAAATTVSFAVCSVL